MIATFETDSDSAQRIVLPDPELAWVGNDRVGKSMRVTRGAFGMPSRSHVWELNRTDFGNEAWTLVADNIPMASAIAHYFGSAAGGNSKEAPPAASSGEALEPVTVTIHCTQMPVIGLGEPELGPDAADVGIQSPRRQVDVGAPDGSHDLASRQHATEIAE